MERIQAARLLGDLQTTDVPPRDEAYYLNYTIGDDVHSLASLLIKEANQLGNVYKYLPRVVLGAYGTGKTHFLRFLRLKMKQELDTSSTLLIWIDLRDLNTIDDFSYLLIRGLRSFDDNIVSTDYQRTVRKIYFICLINLFVQAVKQTLLMHKDMLFQEVC